VIYLQLSNHFIKGIRNEFETTIKRVRSDNGSEFKNTRINEFCDDFGIRHQFLAKYTLQSNGLVERKNRTLIVTTQNFQQTKNHNYNFFFLK
jgi:transposase InsO family protein